MVAGMLGAMLLFFGRQENIAGAEMVGHRLSARRRLGRALDRRRRRGSARTLSLALNAVGFVACGMVWNASRVFHGRKPNLPGLVLGAIAWIGAVVMLPPEDPRCA